MKIDLPGSAELRVLMSAKYRERGISIEALYWSVSVPALHDIVDQVRTHQPQFVAKLRSAMPAGSHAPTLEQVDHAVQSINIITGDHSPATLTSPVAYAETGTGRGITADAAATRWALEVGKPHLDGFTLADKLISRGELEDQLVELWQAYGHGRVDKAAFEARLAEIVEATEG
ncbi:hypothetical protein ACIA8I_39265 [Streptomyces rishiriensis]|uniref:hypothetical protein n=1 Tax=Streptomyces rishiriensis TaxID=68264 RepID=UPI0037877DF1